MNLISQLDQQPGGPPPSMMKVFAPDGNTRAFVGWFGVRLHNDLVELFLVDEEGVLEVLNKKVLVQSMETGEVMYNPRVAPPLYRGATFMDSHQVRWLQENPQWPKVLELFDNPVDNGEENDGLYA